MVKDNSEFAKEFLKDFNDPKKSNKSLGQAVGLPDKEDEEFLMKLVLEYEADNPGWLEYVRDNAREEFSAGKKGSLRNEDAKLDKTSGRTYDFELPVAFYQKVEKHYPLMFKDVSHYRWFKKTFIALMIRPNTKKVK